MRWSFILLFACSFSSAPNPQQKQDVFLESESILWGRDQEIYWVSNMNGMTQQRDADGFISIVSVE